MTVLRSRKVDSVLQKEQSHKSEVQIEPATPAKEDESTNKLSCETTPTPHKLNQGSEKLGSVSSSDLGSVSNQSLRRSARLSSKKSSYNVVENVGSRRKRKVVNIGNREESSVINGEGLSVASGKEEESGGSESVISNVRVSSELNTPSGCEGNGILVSQEESESVRKVKSRRFLSEDVQFEGSESVHEGDVGFKSLNLQSDKKLLTSGVDNVANGHEEKGIEEGESETVDNGDEKTLRRFSSEDKQKGLLVDQEVEIDDIKTNNSRLDIEEKGKGKAVEIDLLSNVSPQQLTIEKTGTSNARKMERFKNIARENASRFAHFSLQEEENPLVDDEEPELAPRQTEANQDGEDWPGPFSTAMKIIKDRAADKHPHPNNLTSEKGQSVQLIWAPKVKHQHKNNTLPSLQEMCMKIMVENVDAITSLEGVPDVLRHKLTQLLCNSRKMNHHFLDLLASESPSEIRVQDCSWLSEEQLTKTFEKTNTSKLTVLQLDQCGRCLPDYVLFTSLAHLRMSALTNISLKGACRLSDSGLNALLACAPALRSINLGCCSLLTSDGIINLADKMGPFLKELYIDECFGIDAMRILPALLRLEHLEVLSISRFETVNDSFIRQFVTVRGQKIKELVLADCTKLTDKSLKVIAENCPGLCSIDLTNLSKLSDTAIEHLANGCQGIQTMKFCRNAFSDEAVAAYIEACGESLRELSLNHVDKVANHTALSLAKHARNLQSLDLSWCREMTNEALGLIVDSCSSLKTLKVFGCTQITNVFMDGHSNEEVKVIGYKGSQILKNIKVADLLPLRYSSAA